MWYVLSLHYPSDNDSLNFRIRLMKPNPTRAMPSIWLVKFSTGVLPKRPRYSVLVCRSSKLPLTSTYLRAGTDGTRSETWKLIRSLQAVSFDIYLQQLLLSISLDLTSELVSLVYRMMATDPSQRPDICEIINSPMLREHDRAYRNWNKQFYPVFRKLSYCPFATFPKVTGI